MIETKSTLKIIMFKNPQDLLDRHAPPGTNRN